MGKKLAAYIAAKKLRGSGPFPCVRCSRIIMIGVDGDFHHPSARRTMETILHFVPICKICHAWVHSQESEALKLGFLTTTFFRSVK